MKCCKIFNFSSLILQLSITNNIFRSENIRSENVENRNLNFKSFSDRKIQKNGKPEIFRFRSRPKNGFRTENWSLTPSTWRSERRRGANFVERFFFLFCLFWLECGAVASAVVRAPSRWRRRRRNLWNAFWLAWHQGTRTNRAFWLRSAGSQFPFDHSRRSSGL